jgi:hypothetical protein
MTIDDNVDFLNEAKKFYEEIANDPSLNETIKCYFVIESLESAINIMRKYQKIQTRLDGLEHSMECLLESDPRTFADRECENGWLFDKIIEWRKIINEVLKDDNSNLDNSSM